MEGEKTLLERSNEKVKDILENHEPEPLPDDIVEELDRIVQEAEAKL